MVQISKYDFERLKQAKLINENEKDRYIVINRNKKSSRKKYFIFEDTVNFKILRFLGIK